MDSLQNSQWSLQNPAAEVKQVARGLSGQGDKLREQAAEAAQDFEAVFISQMLQPMFEGIETGGMFGGGQAEQMYRSMLIDEVGKELARAGGIGIADGVTAELIKLQEG